MSQLTLHICSDLFKIVALLVENLLSVKLSRTFEVLTNAVRLKCSFPWYMYRCWINRSYNTEQDHSFSDKIDSSFLELVGSLLTV